MYQHHPDIHLKTITEEMKIEELKKKLDAHPSWLTNAIFIFFFKNFLDFPH